MKVQVLVDRSVTSLVSDAHHTVPPAEPPALAVETTHSTHRGSICLNPPAVSRIEIYPHRWGIQRHL